MMVSSGRAGVVTIFESLSCSGVIDFGEWGRPEEAFMHVDNGHNLVVLPGTFRTNLKSWKEVCYESKFTGEQPQIQQVWMTKLSSKQNHHYRKEDDTLFR